MTIPANLLQHKLIDAPLQLKTWADLEVVVRLRYGRQVGFEFFVGRCCNPFLFKIQANYCRTSRNNIFPITKNVFCFTHFVQRMEWQALNAQKARVTSAPVRDSLVSMCCFVVVWVFFQRMEFVVENPQVGWKKVVWKIVVICRQIGRLFEL